MGARTSTGKRLKVWHMGSLWHFVLLFPGQTHEGSWSPNDIVNVQTSRLESDQGSRQVKVVLEQSLNPSRSSQ